MAKQLTILYLLVSTAVVFAAMCAAVMPSVAMAAGFAAAPPAIGAGRRHHGHHRSLAEKPIFDLERAHRMADAADADKYVVEAKYERKDREGDRKAFRHYWKECIGSGHALLATRADYQRSLIETVKDIGVKRVRMHGIFDDDMSVVLPKGPYNEAERKGAKAVAAADDGLAFQYEFFNVAQIYDFFLEAGVKPIVELSFMPALLANCTPSWGVAASAPICQTIMHYQGVIMPPAASVGDKAGFRLWEELVEEFAKFLVGRYGIEEVSQWHFEVWNELWGMPYTKEAYLALYDASYRALKRVDAKLKVGGPATMQCQYTGEFVKDNTKRDPVSNAIVEQRFDFVSSHLYPTDPNCTYPAPGYKDIDCFAETIKHGAKAARDQGSDAPFFLTEFNAGLSNSVLLYSSYAAAFIFRNIPLLHDHLDVFSYWTFSDIFEENGMHGGPFEGFNYGIQTQRGIKKPVYRAYQLLKEAGEEQLETVVRDKSEVTPIDVKNTTVTGFTTIKKKDGDTHETVTIFASNFAPQFFTINNADVKFKVKIPLRDGETEASYTCDTKAGAKLIDEDNGNIFKEWEKLGKPLYPNTTQLSAMRASSHIAERRLDVVQTYNSTENVIECHTAEHHHMKVYSAIRVEFRVIRH